MISIFFYQSALFLFFYSFGKKITFNLNKLFKLNLPENEIYINFLFSVFLLSCVPLLLNFFLALTDLLILVIFVVFVIWSFFKIKYNNEDKKNLKVLAITSFLLLPFVINLEIGHDSGLYHLPFQTWLKNYKITFGLSELHSRYALTSLHDYLLSIFWFKNYFILSAILQSSFIVILFGFFINFVLENQNKLFFFYSIPILILFPIWHRYIIFDFGSVDFAFGIIAIILNLQLLKIFNSNNKNILSDISILLILFVYAITLKPSGILFSAIVIPVIIFLYNKKLINILLKTKVKFIILFCSFVLVIWFLRNIIISGCFVYPISFSCLNVSWYNEIYLIEILKQISNYQIHFKTIFKYAANVLNDFNYLLIAVILITVSLYWIFNKKNFFYINQIIISVSAVVILFLIDFESLRGFSNISSLGTLSENYILRDTIIFNEIITIFLSFLSSIFISIAILKIFNLKINFRLNLYNNFLFLFLLCFFCIWFFKSPDPRLGFWIFALLPSVFLSSFISADFNLGKINFRFLTLTILFINLMYIFSFNLFEINKKNKIVNLINHKKIIINSPKIEKREKFGFTPVMKYNDKGIVTDFKWNYCWNVVDCYYNPKDALIIKLPLNYKMVIIEEN